jgi:hypothetical protein
MTVFIDVAVQRAPNGTFLGFCIAVPAEIGERFVDDDTKSLRFGVERLPAGMHFRLVEEEG